MSVKFTSYKSEVLEEIRQAIIRSLEICGGTAEGYAKQLCPRKSGVLANSIAHVPRSENLESIGTSIDYAPYVEFGHNQEPGRFVPVLGKRLVADHVPAKPYLVPAVENHVDEYTNIIKTELDI